MFTKSLFPNLLKSLSKLWERGCAIIYLLLFTFLLRAARYKGERKCAVCNTRPVYINVYKQVANLQGYQFNPFGEKYVYFYIRNQKILFVARVS